ncbi:MAG: ATP-binding protein [Planctomycetes bacterium]|nr:ATP-binding protein [Planctomycetota bacterium]
MKRGKKIRIEGIYVEKLFGLYDYEIPGNEDPKNIEKVLILYGDNGSGKTTILRLIFHLLACEYAEGHKTFVSQTKFKRFIMKFSNKYKVVAKRKGDKLLGTFLLELWKAEKRIASTEFLVDAENITKSGSPNEEENNKFLDTLRSLGLTLYLLGDDRTVHVTNPHGAQRQMYRRRAMEERSTVSTWESSGQELDPEQISIRLLEESMQRLRGWIRNHVMHGSTRGESDVNVIFSDIIENIASEQRRGPRKKATRREYVVERINKIEQRNKEFSKFGLTPSFNGKKLMDAIDKASNKFKSIRPIIVPYLDSHEAKLNALDDIQCTIEKFVYTINSFMVDKSISFRVRRGFTILSRNREVLSPRMLSSGERHLLLLFCNAITALDEQSIFIIDEPEISLNIKWQRNLITSLLDFVKDSAVQYVFASHSMQILAQHEDKVVKLVSTKE